MKKIRTFLGVLTTLLAGFSMLQAGAPVKSYSVSTSTGVVQVTEGSGANVYTPQVGDTLNDLFLTKSGSFEKLDPISFEHQAPALDAMELGSAFTYGRRTMTHFGISAGGHLFLSDSSKVQPVVDPNMTNLGWLQHFTILRFMVKTGENWQGITWDQAVITAGAETKIYVYYDEGSDIQYIGFDKLQVMDTAGKASLLASFQYALHADGKLGFEVVSMQPADGTTTLYGVQAGLVGESSNDVVYLSDWEGGYGNLGEDVELSDKTYPVANTAFNFNLPEACAAINGEDVELSWNTTVTESSLTFNYRTSWKNAEALLVILSQEETLSEENLPVDGELYTADSKIGNSIAVRIGTVNWGSSSFSGGAVKNLEGSTRYYLHAFPYNVSCSDGPVYGNPKVDSVTTPIAAPQGTGIKSLDKNQVVINVGSNPKAAAYMIGFSETGVPNASNIELTEGKVYKTGETIEISGGYGDPNTYMVEILDPFYKESTFTKSELESGKPYHFYVWSVAATGDDTTYSQSCNAISFRTIAEIPATLDFASDFANSTNPIGWTQEEGNTSDFFISQLDGVNYLAVQMVPTYDEDLDAQVPSFSAIKAPLFSKGKYQSMSVILDVKYYQQGFFGAPSSGTHGENDTVLVQVKENDGWKTVHQVLKSNVTVAGDGTAKIYTPEFTTTEETIELRLVCKSFTIPGMNTPYFALKSLVVEPVLNCKNVSELAVIADKTTHESAVLTWKDGNTVFADFMVRYRQEDGQWIGEGQMTGKKVEFEITGLEANHTYVAQVTAVCGEGDTSLSREVSFSTLHGIPYEAPDPMSVDAFPGELQSLVGEIALEGNTAFEKPNSDIMPVGWDMAMKADYSGVLYGINYTKYSNHSWMLLPNLSVGKMKGTASLRFKMSAYYLDEMTYEAGAPQFDKDTLYIYNSSNGEFNVNTALVGKIALEELSQEDSSFYFEFPVESFNQIGFYYVEGESTVSNVLLMGAPSVQMESIVCEPVSNIRQSGLGKTTVTLSWEGSSLEYAVMFKDRRSEEAYDTVYTQETTLVLEDLIPGTAYVYQIMGYCGENRTNASEPSAEHYFNTVDECHTPTIEVIDVTWQSARFAMSSEEKTKLLRVYAQDLENYPSIDYYVNTELDTIRVTGLFAELEFPYYAQVRAICSPGDSSAWSEKVEFTTEPLPECGTPSNLKADVDIEGKTATLTWKMGVNNDYVMLLTKEASAAKFDTTGSYAESYIMRDLKLNTTYTWKLTGYCDTYIQSKEASATFSTEATATESVNGFAGSIKVFAENHQLVVQNPEGQCIRALEVYSLDGKLLKTYSANTNENVFVVTDVMQQMVLVRVIGSANRYASYKVLLF